MSDIITEFRNENTKDIDILPTIEIVRKMNDEDKLVALAVEDEAERIAEGIDLIAKQFLKGGKLYYFGAGTSGRLGILDASECPPTFSVPKDMVTGFIAGGDKAIRHSIEGAEDNPDLGYEDASILKPDDVAVVISASGNPKYLLGVLKRADETGCKTIGITCNPKGRIAEEAGLVICAEVGPEVIAKIGKTYENFMIDLQAVNEKLKDRAIRIVAQIAGVSHSEALAALLKCDWEIKTAIVMLELNFDIEQARAELKKHRGVLRKLLNSKTTAV